MDLDLVRRQEQPREEIRVYMDPPVERADGDTDKDTGEKKIKNIAAVLRIQNPDRDPDFTHPVKKAPDPGSSVRFHNTVSVNFVEKS